MWQWKRMEPGMVWKLATLIKGSKSRERGAKGREADVYLNLPPCVWMCIGPTLCVRLCMN